MNIFEALRASHDRQRELCDQLVKTRGDSEERQNLYKQLKAELSAHAIAEDRYFYIPLMFNDTGLDITRHALAEHHEIDEIIAQLDEKEFSSRSWLTIAKKLSETVHHHLKEEEHGFFQQAGKILEDKEKTSLAKKYLAEYKKYLKEE